MGLACGEAIGGTVEFMPRGSFPPARLAPAVLAFFPDRDAAIDYAVKMTLTAHGAPECIETSRTMADILVDILMGKAKQGLTAERPELAFIARKHADEVQGLRIRAESLEAALWAFFTPTTSVRQSLRQ